MCWRLDFRSLWVRRNMGGLNMKSDQSGKSFIIQGF